MSNTFLICSVGGTAEPVVRSLEHWKPQKVYFIVSKTTRPIVDTVLSEYAFLWQGCVDYIEITNPEELESVVEKLRSVTVAVHKWKALGDGYTVVADFTGGTKCMSAGLALVARRWPCQFSYVGGSRRSKDGVGIVESGTEIVKSWGNPWDVLGYQAVEDAVTVFNQGGYAAAAAQVEASMKTVQDSSIKRTLLALFATTNAFAAWDRFDHNTAIDKFQEALRLKNDLKDNFAEPDKLIYAIKRNIQFCTNLKAGEGPTWPWVDDLINNAMRRAKEQRFDDAVARLYRACEAIAQVRLREQFQIKSTGSVPIEKLPKILQEKWASRAVDGCVKIGLQEGFSLLACLQDDFGKRFNELKLAGMTSPLSARNSSILAHGFQPVSKEVYEKLLKSVCTLRGDSDVSSGSWDLPEVR